MEHEEVHRNAPAAERAAALEAHAVDVEEDDGAHGAGDAAEMMGAGDDDEDMEPHGLFRVEEVREARRGGLPGALMRNNRMLVDEPGGPNVDEEGLLPPGLMDDSDSDEEEEEAGPAANGGAILPELEHAARQQAVHRRLVQLQRDLQRLQQQQAQVQALQQQAQQLQDMAAQAAQAQQAQQAQQQQRPVQRVAGAAMAHFARRAAAAAAGAAGAAGAGPVPRYMRPAADVRRGQGPMWDEDEEEDGDEDGGQEEEGGYEGWVLRGGRPLHDAAGPGPGSMQASGQDDLTVESFSDDEASDEAQDTTAEQLKQGKDIQGIPWERLQFSREHYRTMRLRSFRNYTNVLPDDASEYRAEILASANPSSPTRGAVFYDFVRNSRTVQSTIVHFQLRNLVWATSRNDVFVVHENCVQHWNPATRALTPVLDMNGGQEAVRLPGIGAVQVSTTCVKDGLLAVGGFHGELACVRLDDMGTAFSGRVTRSDNGITNGIEVCDVRGPGRCVLASNNDCMLRLYSAETFQLLQSVQFPWAVNYAVVDPAGRLAAVVGDNEVAQLTDLASGNSRPVAELQAHRDYSFAVAWHPDGTLLATGNQDTTAALWDMRKLATPVARLCGHMGAVRSLRFSPDGRFLAMAEPADFVHIYDVKAGFEQVQEIDLFGEIAGVAFSPHADAFFVGVADLTYSSLLEFDQHH